MRTFTYSHPRPGWIHSQTVVLVFGRLYNGQLYLAPLRVSSHQ